MTNRKARRAMASTKGQKGNGKLSPEKVAGTKPLRDPNLPDKGGVDENYLMALASGKVTVDDPTINYLLEKYREARNDHLRMSQAIKEAKVQLAQAEKAQIEAQARTNTYADDLRHWAQKLVDSDGFETDPNKKYGPTVVPKTKGKDDDRGDQKQADSGG